jgi:hypothetical protein
MTATERDRWTGAHWLALGAIVLTGIAIRVALLPAQGLRGDLDQFVAWANGIALDGLGRLYQDNPAGPVGFGPVMGYVWWALTLVEPGFAAATDASSDAIRILMKVPASLADVGLALVVGWAGRVRPTWAVVAAAAVLLHPAVIDVSAWWGQYESILLLLGAGAAVAAVNGRNGLAAAFVAAALMTKPQAVPFLLPFAAWFWATGYGRGGVRGGALELARTGLIGLAVMAILWLPFLGHGGPTAYLANIAAYQGEDFAFLSLRAWNAWWLVQEAAAGGGFIADDVAFLGPLTLRHVAYLLTAGLSLLVAAVIIRDPRPRTLLLGLATAVLVAFTFLTQMHERYAYGAIVFLALLLAERDCRWLFAALSVVFTLNLLAAVPPTDAIGAALPVSGVLGVAGSVAMIALTGWAYLLLRDSRPRNARPYQ